MMKRKTYKDKIGDGCLPNLYWVAISNDYAYVYNGHMIDWIGDILIGFESMGKTRPRPFKTFAAAKQYCDTEFRLGEFCTHGFVVNRITIEDRMTGVLYEKTRLFDPVRATIEDWENDDTEFTRSSMEEKGVTFK